MADPRIDTRPRAIPRFLAIALLSALTGVVMVGSIGVAPVRAAEDELREAVSTTYRVDPAKGVIHVTLDITVTNRKPDTTTRSYYYNAIGYSLQPGAESVKATSNGSRLTAKSTAKDDHTEVTIRIPNLYHNKTRKVRLTYDLPGAQPRSANRIRVGRAHAEFSAWAWGDPGRADIRIVLPDTFTGDVDVRPDGATDPVLSTKAGGLTTYAARGIAKPHEWYAIVNVSDRDALTDVRLELAGKQVTIHAWPEDTTWLRKVSTVLQDSLPVLEAKLGLPWPVDGELDVTEVSSAEILGYAGVYDSSDHEIQISEELDEHVIVHEAAHAWFDRGRFALRWITEGLADEYASRTVAAVNGTESLDPDQVSSTQTGAFRLNAWPPPSRIDEDTSPVEDYGYNASWIVVRAVVGEVTEERMRDVFDTAAAGTLTYVGAGPAEPSHLAKDWRGFLDLVEDVGGSDQASSVFETWVVTDTEKGELVDRKTARSRYARLVAQGGDWLPGIVVRKPMGDWEFDKAEKAMGAAEAVLADRAGLATTTTELGLAFPAALETAYESADSTDDLTAMSGRIDTWLDATGSIRAARDALARERSPLAKLGLMGTRPEDGYAAALNAWAAGDDKGVVTGTSATLAALAGAAEIGRGRFVDTGVSVIVVMLAIMLLVVAVAALRRGLRRRRSAAVGAAAGAEPYATLAATPDPVEGAEVGGDGGEGAQPD